MGSQIQETFKKTTKFLAITFITLALAGKSTTTWLEIRSGAVAPCVQRAARVSTLLNKPSPRTGNHGTETASSVQSEDATMSCLREGCTRHQRVKISATTAMS